MLPLKWPPLAATAHQVANKQQFAHGVLKARTLVRTSLRGAQLNVATAMGL